MSGWRAPGGRAGAAVAARPPAGECRRRRPKPQLAELFVDQASDRDEIGRLIDRISASEVAPLDQMAEDRRSCGRVMVSGDFPAAEGPRAFDAPQRLPMSVFDDGAWRPICWRRG
jgi:hypothetical protein